MTKYNESFKRQVIEFYLQHAKNRALTRKTFQLTESTLRHWIQLFHHHGLGGLTVSTTKTCYATEFKLAVLQHMHQHALSFQEVSLHFGLPHKSIVYQWLQAFEKDGINGLKPKRKGRATMKPKYPKMPPPPKTEEERLRYRILELEAEIAILKKWQEMDKQEAIKQKRRSSKP